MCRAEGVFEELSLAALLFSFATSELVFTLKVND